MACETSAQNLYRQFGITMTLSRALLAISFIVPVCIFLTTSIDSMVPGFFADEAVYFAMIQSLAKDADLIWTREDLARICETHPAGPVGVILKERPDGTIVYAKPITYPLAAAIFYLLGGSRGLILFNFLAAWFIVYWLSRQWGASCQAILSASIALFFSAWSPYILWYHTEIFTSFALTGFFVYWIKSSTSRNSFAGWIMAIFLSLAVSIKPPLALLGVPAAVDLLKKRKFKPFIAFFASIAVIACLTLLLTGNLNPYEGNRRIFINQFPLDSSAKLFDQGDSWSTENAGFYFNANVFIWNSFYFWFGRFSGILWYFFPGVITAILAFRMKGNIRSKSLLLCMILLIILQLILIPSNYHGGGGALGNRLFASLYPLLLFVLPAMPSRKILLPVALCAGFFSAPFLIHPWMSSSEPGEFTRQGFYASLPAEWTLTGAFPIFHPSLYRVQYPELDGFVYFLDRHSSGLKDNGFEIISGARSQMILDLNAPHESLNLRLQSNSPGATGMIRSRNETTMFVIGSEPSDVMVKLGNGHHKIDIYGFNRWVYPMTFQIEPGSQPEVRDALAESKSKVHIQFFSLTAPQG